MYLITSFSMTHISAMRKSLSNAKYVDNFSEEFRFIYCTQMALHIKKFLLSYAILVFKMNDGFYNHFEIMNYNFWTNFSILDF